MRKSVRLFFLIVSLLALVSCGSSKHTRNIPSSSSETSANPPGPKLLKVRKNALDYLGTRYRYGGTTRKGMDCSGLIYTAFMQEGIALPRTARDMSLMGDRLNLKETQNGDLLFFETNKKRSVINHVGLIVEKEGPLLHFIHSTSSRGVIISTMDEAYWRSHFVMARRIH